MDTFEILVKITKSFSENAFKCIKYIDICTESVYIYIKYNLCYKYYLECITKETI